ncbi:hypothetical protein GCK72_009034 [Caenorhabditis remanei]|uniref:Uncharacterized protein n=1 Tax=Caenorhabditis remanei TaxID=31234 RepID=A0A6A5H1X5_CAERE|nr:hypothetical protein GCK72_009034 [Caenorhabditis remanei]KAF1760784.1 hypothetical protein GCK72_009034 [Caenorhabditis remanei]
MTCIFNGSFMESDRFLAYALHTLTSIEIPLHVIGAYLIIFKTPRAMKTAKHSILQLHVTCTMMDLMITSFWIFYWLIPSAGGFPVGLMTNIGINSTVQAFIAFNVMLAVALTYVSFFENRYDALVIGYIGRSQRRNFWRAVYFIVNIIYVESILAFVFLNMTTQEEGRRNVELKQPCIPSSLLNNPNFINLNVKNEYLPHFIGSMVLIIFLQGLYFVFYTTYYLFKDVAHVSKTTRMMQRKFFLSMFLQAVIPALSIALPFHCYYYLWKTRYFYQTYNNLAMIAMGCNGLFSTLVMILVHHPYRSAVLEMCRVRKIEFPRSVVATMNLRPLVKISGG